MYTYARTIPTTVQTDVLVCGGGLAGIGAAVAAARSGARTLLVERMGFSGGFFTAVIGSAFDGLIDTRSGRPVVGGVVFEMLDRMGILKGRDPRTSCFTYNGEISQVAEHPDWITPTTEPERFKRAADEILLDAGVQVLYHTQVADAVTRDGQIEAVIVSNKAGLVAIQPKVVVDCTGDADVAAWAGAPYEVNDPIQPMSLHFRVIDVHAPADMALRDRCTELFQRAHAEGKLGSFGGPWPARFMAHDLYFNATRVPGNMTDPADWTRAEIQGRKDAWTMFHLLKENLPEFRDAYMMATGPTAGARESRRIVGLAMLTEQDVWAGRRRDDAVVLGGGKLDRHGNAAATQHTEHLVPPYDISYGTLVPQGVGNLLVAGRCHSATSAALASSRLTATAMGMGQAAGIAAALAVESGRRVPEVDVPALQSRIVGQGGILEVPAVPAAV
ncbi:MAG: FAD-dependent oxidoreductase [Chloroflexi bacterium]|nr:FAD-dependent oxidoreductase [Chloroflexota bacterium]